MAWGRKAPEPEKPVNIKRVKNKIVYREDIITLDFETYYETGKHAYSLSTLSYSEYIRDPRFEMICCAVKVGTGKTKVMEEAEFTKWCKKIDWSKYDLLCHNTPFDGFIMSHHFKVIPRRYLDTLAMARGLFGNDIRGDLDSVSLYLGGKGKIKGALESVANMHKADIKAKPKLWKDYTDYCGQDGDECYDAYHKMLVLLPAIELDKIDIFVRAFCAPVLEVDRPRVEKELAREIAEKKRIIMSAVGTAAEQAKLIKLLGEDAALEHAKKELGSSPKFAEILMDMGVQPPKKISPTTGKEVWAFSKTDEDFLAFKEHPNKAVRDLVEARLSVKSVGNETKAGRFLKVSENGMKLPVLLSYYAAHTGRPGGGNKMNMLNMERGGELRKSILAPKDHMLCVGDSGQIEARLAMWLADQMDALEEFKLGDAKLAPDPYCLFASDVYGYPVTTDHKDERHVGKVSKLSLQYQAGPPRFQTMMALGALGGKPMFLELDECQRIVYLFRRKHPMLVKFWELCHKKIIPDMVRGHQGEWKCIKWEKERVWLPNGMCLKYPGIREHQHENGVDYSYLRKGEPSKIYGGLLTENIVQALANIIITEQMVEIAKKYPIVMMTYDENVWLAHKKEAKKAFEYGLKIMATAPEWCLDLPLKAEGGYAENYSKH